MTSRLAALTTIGEFFHRVHPLRVAGHALVASLWLLVAVIAWEGVLSVQRGASAIDGLRRTMLGFDPQQVDEFSRVQKILRDLLEDLRTRTEADRAVLVMLHNGKSSLGGIPFLSVSGFVEGYRPGLSAGIQHFVDLPLSEIHGVSETLAGETLVYRPNALREGEIVRSIGVDVVVRGAVIRSFNGIPHGWIFLGYTDHDWKAHAARQERFKQVLDRYTAIVTGVLNATSISEMISAVEDHKQLE